MRFLAIDLEMNQPSNTIIQIGAAIGEYPSKNILGDCSLMVNTHELITPYIVNLTGITQEDVRNGYSLKEAYAKLVQFYGIYDNVFVNPVTWGGGDTELLRKNIPADEEWIFGNRWIDAKTLFVSLRFANELKHQAGLSKAMNKLGLDFDGKKHNAKFDAINTLVLYFELLDRLKES